MTSAFKKFLDEPKLILKDIYHFFSSSYKIPLSYSEPPGSLNDPDGQPLVPQQAFLAIDSLTFIGYDLFGTTGLLALRIIVDLLACVGVRVAGSDPKGAECYRCAVLDPCAESGT